MFQLYLLLRLKNFGRIVIELGIFRIVFLTILTVAAIMILFLAENRFAIPVVCVLLLAGYHEPPQVAVGVKEYAYKRSYQQISDDITPIDKHFISEYILYLHFKVCFFFYFSQ